MSRFLQLPLDLLSLIFNEFIASGDLRALCKTCKAFYTLAIPRLYYTLSLPDDISSARLESLCSLRNRGLTHIKHLHVYVSRNFDSKDPPDCNRTLEVLTSSLPCNSLLSLRLDIGVNVDQVVLNVLHGRQTNLSTLRCVASNTWRAPTIKFEILTTIQLLINSTSFLPDVRQVLKEARRLESLELFCDFPNLYSQTENDAQLHERTVRELLGSVIGAPGQRDSVNFPTLSALRLRGIDLKLAAACLMPSIDASKLTVLGLNDCKEMPTLFELMIRPIREGLYQLRHLEVIYTRPWHQSRYRDESWAFNTLLGSVDSLETLILSVGVEFTPRLDYIENNSKFLRCLYLDVLDQNMEPICAPPARMRYILSQCQNIEQLGISFERDSYSEGDDAVHPQLMAAECLPKLKTLRVLNQPKATIERGDPVPTCEYAEPKLKSIATRLFQSVQAEIVTLGKSGLHRESDDAFFLHPSMDEKTYIRSKSVDARGVQCWQAVEVSRKAAREAVIESDILDIDVLSRAQARTRIRYLHSESVDTVAE